MTSRIFESVVVYDRLHVEGESVSVEDLGLESEVVDEALTLHRAAVRLRKALVQVEAALGEQLAGLLGDGGAVRYGDTFYRYHRGWTETVNDDGSFWSMVRTFDSKGDLRIEDLFNPNTVRKGKLPEAIRDTAFTRRRDAEPSLSAVPADRAPSFLSGMEDGDYTLGRKLENEGDNADQGQR